MTQYATIRDYNLTYYDGNNPPYILLDAVSPLDHYAAIPTPEEANAAFNVSPAVDVRYTSLFYGEFAEAYPRIPEGGSTYNTLFTNSYIKVSPMLPHYTNFASFFSDTDLTDPPVIPHEASSMYRIFRNDPIKWPVSVPANVVNLTEAYKGCEDVTGEMIVRPTSMYNYTDMFKGTIKPITLYGKQSFCENLAATANNNNVIWSPWYDPVPAVTDRGPGSYTTAADMTRMVRNGALAVDTYAPGRMVYQQGDIVREDEWIALVEAAQTMDPTITFSTHYANLNRIEAAFDSAL